MNIPANDNIGFWLFYTQRHVEHAFAETLKACCMEHEKPYMITPAQWSVLHLLTEEDGLTIGRISKKRFADAPTVTGIVTRLEQSGLVERRHDRTDRRSVKVYLTDEGREIMNCLFEEVEEMYHIMVRGLSEADQHDLQVKLQQIIANVSAIVRNSGDRFSLAGHCEPEEGQRP